MPDKYNTLVHGPFPANRSDHAGFSYQVGASCPRCARDQSFGGASSGGTWPTKVRRSMNGACHWARIRAARWLAMTRKTDAYTPCANCPSC